MNHLWTRRQFSQAVAATAATSFVRSAPAEPRHPAFAYVASTPSTATGTIHVFEISGTRWHSIQIIAAPAPAHLEPHPTLPILYATHAVDLWDHLPRGAVSAYTMDRRTGQLTLRQTQPLSLSATGPRHAAISPDGRHLLFTAERGGILNLLPLTPDGSLQPPSAIRKELGMTVQSAAASRVLFHPDGTTALTLDSARRTLSLLTIVDDTLTLRHRHTEATASQIALSPCGNRLYALNAGTLTLHRLYATHIAAPCQTLAIQPASHPVMVLNGNLLFLAGDHTLQTLAVDPASGRLSAARSLPLQEPLRALSARTTHLHGLTASGSILHIPLRSGARPRTIANVPGASTLLLRA